MIIRMPNGEEIDAAVIGLPDFGIVEWMDLSLSILHSMVKHARRLERECCKARLRDLGEARGVAALQSMEEL